MIRSFILLLFLSITPFHLHATGTPTPHRAEGTVGWTLKGLGGETLSLTDLSQGATVMVVWASWSPRCHDIVKRVQSLEKEWAARARVLSVVFQEDQDQIKAFLDDQRLDSPIFVDETGRFSKDNAVTTLPALLIFEDGELTFRGRLPTDPDPTIAKTLG